MTVATRVSIASLTEGVLGGVLGALGAFFAAWLTIRHDKRSGARERQETAVWHDQNNRRAAAREVFAVFEELNREVRYAPYRGNDGVRAFLRVATDFNINCGQVHPDAAEWIFEQFKEYQLLARSRRRVCIVPFLNRLRAERTALQIAQMTGALTKWASGSIGDSDL